MIFASTAVSASIQEVEHGINKGRESTGIKR